MPSIVHEVNIPFRKIGFGMGCFWAGDSLFGATPGVLRTRVGYSGGTTAKPTYKNIGDHTEIVEIDYDPKQIGLNDLLEIFWNNHEYGLIKKIKTQYTSLILYHDEEQKRSAEISLKNETNKRKTDLITRVVHATEFYPAEDYHQKYRLQEHPWLYEAIGMTTELLTTSHAATRLNGYVVGLGDEREVYKTLEQLGLSEKIIQYVTTTYKENKGGNLYC